MRSDYSATLDADQCPICGAFAWKRAPDRPAVPARTFRFLRWAWTTTPKPHRKVAICQACYWEQEYRCASSATPSAEFMAAPAP